MDDNVIGVCYRQIRFSLTKPHSITSLMGSTYRGFDGKAISAPTT